MKFENIFGGDGATAVLAGALGGLVRWITLRHNWKEGLGAMIVGSICALYLGPLVKPLLEPAIGPLAPGGNTEGFAAFVVGLGGISLAGIVIDIMNARWKRGGDDEQG